MIRIGIICPSEIALRRFLPALKKCHNVTYAGVAVANKEEFEGATDAVIQNEYKKAQQFVDEVGGKIFSSYSELVNSDEVDAIYLPLPPGLHYKWAKEVLLAGKHALVEKPCVATLSEAQELIQLAKDKSLALHENYMFVFHKQIDFINKMISDGDFGAIRLFRINFGFPLRAANDFRYNKNLGGGALLDCTGYTIRYASILLGPTARIIQAHQNYIDGYEVDMYGSATMINEKGLTAQLAWGMDNCYRCELDVWGNKGMLRTNRVLTAPVGYTPEAVVKFGNEPEQIITLPEDDAFMNSIEHFVKCINCIDTRDENYQRITRQAELINEYVACVTE